MNANSVLIFLIFLFAITQKVFSFARFDNETYADLLENEGLNATQLAKKYNYPLEVHWITTEDGYIIQMHRVPYGKNNTNRSNRPPVLISHGSGGSSTEFLFTGPRSIAFMFAEAGYDVWLGNARGTVWSTKHKYLNRRSKEYWMFSWHEIGVYDYTAEIYHILNVTGQEKVFFLGHSQGSTSFLAMAAVRPEINEKIRLAMLMGPSAFAKHNKNPVILVAVDNVDRFQGLMDYLHLYEIPAGPGLSSILRMLCKSVLDFICKAYVNLTMGYDTDTMDLRLLHVAISNLPAGLSFRQMSHYAQIYKTKRFQQFDYGPEENLKRYGSKRPPKYDLTKVTAPVALIYGTTDAFVDPEDARDLCKALPNCVFNYFIDDPMFNHVAYLVARDADVKVNRKMLEMMSQY